MWTCSWCERSEPLQFQMGHMRNCPHRPGLMFCPSMIDVRCERTDLSLYEYYDDHVLVERCLQDYSSWCETNMNREPDELPF